MRVYLPTGKSVNNKVGPGFTVQLIEHRSAQEAAGGRTRVGKKMQIVKVKSHTGIRDNKEAD